MYEDLKLYTTDFAPGKVVVRTTGLVYGCAASQVRDKDKLRWAASDVRRQALEELCKDALGTGGNAVLGLRFTSSLSGGGLVMEAYGTAVELRAEDRGDDLELEYG